MYAKPRTALSAYGKIANAAETDPLLQIVMLYDGAIKFLRQTAADIEADDLPAKAEHSNRALEIVSYLQSILDFKRGGEAAPILDHFYRSLTVMILRASVELDAAKMRAAADLIVPVRDAWEANAKTAAAPDAGMHNAGAGWSDPHKQQQPAAAASLADVVAAAAAPPTHQTLNVSFG